ncbi:hypothetical protein AMTRI_Chr01g129560 [Amborella trichopoda]
MKGHHFKNETLIAEGKLHLKWRQLRPANSRLHSTYCGGPICLKPFSYSISLSTDASTPSLSLNHTKSTTIHFLSQKPDEPYLSLVPSLSLNQKYSLSLHFPLYHSQTTGALMHPHALSLSKPEV